MNDYDEEKRAEAREKDRKAREQAAILRRDREAHAAAQTDVFRVGDVVRNREHGRLWLLEGNEGLIGWAIKGSLCELAYRASPAALEQFARPESVEFMERVRREDPGAWFRANAIDSETVMAFSEGCARYMASSVLIWYPATGEKGFTYGLTHFLAHPESAKRWLEREAAKQANAPRTGKAAIEWLDQHGQGHRGFFGVDKAVPGSDRTGVVAWLPTDAKPAGERLTGVRVDRRTGVPICPCGAQLFVAGFDKCGDCRRETKLGILRQSLDRRIAIAKDEADPEGYVWSRPGAESP